MLAEMAQASITAQVLPDNNKEDTVLAYQDVKSNFRSLNGKRLEEEDAVPV